MEIITVTKENLEQEHICCAISNNGDCQVMAKKAWLSEQLEQGLVFKKGDVRGKVFIEYIPAENAWCPVEAKGYMFINCLWVSGAYKGQGISNALLNACIEDSKAKGKKGLVIVSSKTKRAYLADKKYLLHKGFKQIDQAEPYYELLYLSFDEDNGLSKPQFKACAKEGKIDEKGFVLYYSHQCPFTAKYVPLIEKLAEERNIPFKLHQYKSALEAQNAPVPSTTYTLFYEGKFITHEILSDKKFIRLLEGNGIVNRDKVRGYND